MEFIIVLFIGFIAGFLGGTVGGGGMISLTSLILLGYSPQMAITINKIGDIGAFIPTVWNYWRHKKIEWKMASILIVISIIASVIGANIMLNLNTKLLKIIIGVVILCFLPFLFISKDIGIKKKKKSTVLKIIGYVIFFILAIINAIAGAGGATVVLFIMIFFFGFKIIEGYATNTPAQLIMAFIPAIIFIFNGYFNLIPSISIFIGMLIGGYVGSKTAIKKGNKWVKVFLMIVVIALVLKTLFFNGS